ncbi:MAG: hypothetical protein EOO01_42205 [Chitinophagaceae bacterium]|nr:MAG: hypothetical protein EOO01_42205 [Chitinophagaceae bacterium]
MARKSMTPIVLAGLAAAAYYAYTKMTPEQKENVFGSIKKTGQDLLSKLMPQSPDQANGNSGGSQVG